MEEVITAAGHPNVTATHQSTLEVTTDDFLTEAGDCIIAIEADRAPADFDPAFVDACRSASATIEARLLAAGHEWRTVGRGDPELTFESDRSAVLRTSEYVDDRTVALEVGGAAADVDRRLIEALADGAGVHFVLSVHP